jgi:hypothetical protein
VVRCDLEGENGDLSAAVPLSVRSDASSRCCPLRRLDLISVVGVAGSLSGEFKSCRRDGSCLRLATLDWLLNADSKGSVIESGEAGRCLTMDCGAWALNEPSRSCSSFLNVCTV